MKRLFSWLLACVMILSLLPAVSAAEGGEVTPTVEVGWHFCAALDENGTVWTWGENDSGQLGDGTTESRWYAAPVPDLTDVVRIFAGTRHMMALKADGTLWAWGENNMGELGLGYQSVGDSTSVPTPQKVILPEGEHGGVADVAIANQSTVLVMEDGTVWGWGLIPRRYENRNDGEEELYHVHELDGCGVVCAEGQAVNGNRFLFLAGSGTPEDPSRLYGWGTGTSPNWQLTDEKFDDRIPKEIVFPGSGYITDLETSDGSVFAIAGGQETGIYIWGSNDSGQAGTGESSTEPLSAPHKLAGYHTSPPVQVSSVQGSIVALHEDGTLWLWGQDDILMPGSSYGDAMAPARLPIDHIVAVANRGTSTIALRQDGVVYSRGKNNYGMLGRPEEYGEFSDREFDLTKPVLKEDGSPLSLFAPSGQGYYLIRQLDPAQGCIEGSPSGSYQAGETVTLIARPWEGYRFMGWEAEGIALPDPGASTISFTMPAGDVTVTARFEKELPGMAGGGPFLEEAGTADPLAVPISTAEQLAAIGINSDYPLNGSYVLTADLDLSGYENWSPIGDGNDPFTGIFDGQGHVISGLTYVGEDTYVGLFGRINERGQVKNLGLTDVSITVTGGYDDYYVGGIVGRFENCYMETSRAELRNCYVTGEIAVSLNYGSNLWLGGLAGELAADMSGCFNLASLSGRIGSTYGKALQMGGLAGRIQQSASSNDYVIEKCFNSGELTPDCLASSLFAGGVVGYLDVDVTLRQCYNTANVWLDPGYSCGRNAYLGGIAGFTASDIQECYNLGDVGSEACNDSPYYEMVCGGIVGQFALANSEYSCFVEECYNAGKVVARSYGVAYAGGILGNAEENFRSVYLRNCVALSPEISAYYDELGGGGSTGSSGPFEANVLGNGMTSISTYKNYYLSGYDSGGAGLPVGKPSYSTSIGERYATDGAWYEDTAKWDFDSVWTWSEEENSSLPYFAWVTDGFQILGYEDGEVELFSRLNGEKLTLCAASYDADGRLLDTAMTAAAPEAGISRVLLPLAQEGAAVRIFLWRSMNLKPAARALQQ